MMKKTITFLLMGLSFAVLGQMKVTNTLKIGEKIPNVSLGKVVNYGYDVKPGKEELFVNDIKGKLVILDFWGTHCGLCIASFPKMEALQKEFGDKLMILAVGGIVRRPSKTVYNDVELLVNKWRGTAKELKLPSTQIIVPDSQLYQLFKYYGVPTYVVIDPEGVFRLITQDVFDKQDIQNMLDRKFEIYTKYNYKPRAYPGDQFLLKQSLNKKLIFDSSVAPYTDSLNWTTVLDTTGSETLRFYAVNQSVAKLYENIYYKYAGISFDQTKLTPDLTVQRKYILDTDDPNLYHILKGPELRRKYFFCYEVIADKKRLSYKEFCKRIISDLDQKFGISSSVEIKKVKIDGVNHEEKILVLKERFL